MKNKIIRIHNQTKSGVASIYIEQQANEYKLSKDKVLSKQFRISIIVGKTKRNNNDWFNGDREGNKYHNKSTGSGLHGLSSILSTLDDFIVGEILKNGYCMLLVQPTDEKRAKLYDSAIKRRVKRYEALKLTHIKDWEPDGTDLYLIDIWNSI